MHLKIETTVNGKLDWLQVLRKDGTVKYRVENVTNLLTELSTSASLGQPINNHYLMESTAESYEDLPGTWSQSGNTITRATGLGTFPSSPSHIGNELRWGTGERVHVTARASDTSITVSGPTRSITGGTIRRYIVNGQGIGANTGSKQNVTPTVLSDVHDDTAGTRVRTVRANFTSATVGYTLGSIITSNCSRIKLPTPVVIDVEDQVQYQYATTETVTGRSLDYELGAEAVGLPQKYAITTISGNGTNVDVTFGVATHFLAGDKLDLRGVVPKEFAIATTSSNSTTLTFNTSVAHGRSPGDTIVVAGVGLAGYNGTWTAATASGTVITVTDASNPGASSGGTIRLATPAGYFNSLGLATIASMVSTSVARITSAVTGVAVNPVNIGGGPGVKLRWRRGGSSASWLFQWDTNYCTMLSEANTKAIMDVTTPGYAPIGGGVGMSGSAVVTSAAYTNDWVYSALFTWNAGVGTGMVRAKQFTFGYSSANYTQGQFTLDTPFTKADGQRVKITMSKQVFRTLDLTGLP